MSKKEFLMYLDNHGVCSERYSDLMLAISSMREALESLIRAFLKANIGKEGIPVDKNYIEQANTSFEIGIAWLIDALNMGAHLKISENKRDREQPKRKSKSTKLVRNGGVRRPRRKT